MIGEKRREKELLKIEEMVERKIVEIEVKKGIDKGKMILSIKRREMRMIKELGKERKEVEKEMSWRVKIGKEMWEGRNLKIMGKIEIDRKGKMINGIDMGRRKKERKRKEEVKRREDKMIEKVGLEEDMEVGDRDKIGRNEGRKVVEMSLDERKRSKREREVLVVEIWRELEKKGVKVEKVERIRLKERRKKKKKRNMEIRERMIRKIVIEDEGVMEVVKEILKNGEERKRREIMNRGRIGWGGRKEDRILEWEELLEKIKEMGKGRKIMEKGEIEEIKIVIVREIVVDRIMVEEGVENDRGIEGMEVEDEKIEMEEEKRDKRVDGIEEGRNRIMERIERNNEGRIEVKEEELIGIDREIEVNRIEERIEKEEKKLGKKRKVEDWEGEIEEIELIDVKVGKEDKEEEIVDLKVKRNEENEKGELENLKGMKIIKKIEEGDKVEKGKKMKEIGEIRIIEEVIDLIFKDRGNLRGEDVNKKKYLSERLREESLVRREV